ncbi:hypothetical protein [Methylorubrum extorquens]|uniref:Uracil-DNA glycosylase-like domain-containing protein n=1 Tax=Methylorubrum extorquens (strain ATCC 14718 / DSM 1338 / JCM 2805 / NCIMB 9133 / AM1) TaxID=272630 RepID=C5B0B4_METEA|nr:hypothetical protein [Methylorubrum extorquens]ACS39464.1 conserved hypothetical protein [Methylorubrum extorquens AM1]MCP1542426.1 hypothetical protein [Methylorubrum extorquens]MCP1590229.1 hypothetical protein [Methylorubrum extorquens]
MSALLARFAPVITAASEAGIHADPTLSGSLVLGRSGDLAVSYAPFEHVVPTARIVIVGITPGAEQARNALLELRRALLAGSSHPDALARAKVFASFSGPMRNALVAMLDHVGVHRAQGIAGSASLWTTHAHLVHFTSALRFPVFRAGQNYRGSPSMLRTSLLREQLDENLAEEARVLAHAIWVPCGPKAAEAVNEMVRRRHLPAERVLDGMPHPSGANAERIAYFLGKSSREGLSVKTDPVRIDAAREAMLAKLARLGSRAAEATAPV